MVGGDPLGRGDGPALSWWLPEGATTQHAYRIRTADGYDSGEVAGDVQTLVRLPGFDRSRRATTARVRLMTDAGESGWSEPVAVGTGLLEESDWTATWVGPDDARPGAPGHRPAYWLRAPFEVRRPGPARLHVTSLGLYEVWVNGGRVGDVELAPGYTQYRERVQVQTYDVSDLVVPGPNVVAVLLADGWFRGQIGMPRAADQYGTDLALRLQLEDAEAEVAVTATDLLADLGALARPRRRPDRRPA